LGPHVETGREAGGSHMSHDLRTAVCRKIFPDTPRVTSAAVSLKLHYRFARTDSIAQILARGRRGPCRNNQSQANPAH
jgi:hypothetical protein